MSGSGIAVVSPAYRDLQEVYRGAKHVFACTPFFSRDGLEVLENSIRKAKRAEFWIALNVTHWMTGHSDFDALEGMLRRMQDTFDVIDVRVRGNLHSKLYYAPDVGRALFGSSNLTASGFGGNIEIGAVVSGKTCEQIDDWIEGQRGRVQSIGIEDFCSCVDLSRDAVKAASDAMQDSGPTTLDDFNAAVDLFEKELVKKLTPSRPASKTRSKKSVLELGRRRYPILS